MGNSITTQDLTNRRVTPVGDARPKFLITAVVLLIGSVGAVVYIIMKVPPSVIPMAFFLALSGFAISVLFALVGYKFGKLEPFETPRDLFRRKFKLGILVGISYVTAMLIQKGLDVF